MLLQGCWLEMLLCRVFYKVFEGLGEAYVWTAVGAAFGSVAIWLISPMVYMDGGQNAIRELAYVSLGLALYGFPPLIILSLADKMGSDKYRVSDARYDLKILPN